MKLRPALPLALTLGGVVALGGARWALRRPAGQRSDAPLAQTKGGPARPAQARTHAHAAGCRFAPGQGLAFDFAYQLDLELSGEGLAPVTNTRAQISPKQRVKAASEGTVQGTVLSVAAGGEATVAVRLAAWKTEPASPEQLAGLEADLLRPYLLRVGPRCQIQDAARHRQASPIAYARVLSLYDQIDFLTPDASDRYTGRHRDDLGAFTARYRFVPGPGRGSLERTRVAYDAPTGDALPLSFQVVRAAGAVRLGDAPWFDEISQSDQIEGRARGQTPLRQQTQGRFTSRPADPAAFAGPPLDPSPYVWGRPGERELDDARQGLVYSDLAGLSTDEAWRRFQGILAAKKPGAWHEAQQLLRAWLKLNPDGARELARRMRAGKLTEGEQADAALAMAKSGSDAARRELQAMARDAALGEKLRTQATSALADLANPTRDTVDTLAQLASRSAPSPNDYVGSAATMAVGSLIEGHPGSDAARAAQAYLDQRLADTQTRSVAEALWSVSNSGDAHFLPAVLERAASDDPDLRAAAHAMRKMPPSSTAPALQRLMHDDTHPEVIKEVAQSQREQTQAFGVPLSDTDLALYATKLPSAPEPVRWEIVRTLGAASRRQTKARAVLAGWYPHETVNALKVLIGQYVPATELL